MSTRTALVTGGSRGIGRGIAVALGRASFAVAINYRSNEPAARECAEMVQQAGGRGVPVQGDVANLDDHARIIAQAVAALGPIDTLVNNAGIAPRVRADLLDAAPASFDELMATNLRGPFFLTQRVARHIIEHRSRYDPSVTPSIVNISSISAYTASVDRGEYCISKAGVGMMSALFAARLAEHRIAVYEVRPGIIDTDMTAARQVREKYDKLITEGRFPLRRWGQPEDVGKAVLALATGCLAYSTGQTIDVDGGFHLRRL